MTKFDVEKLDGIVFESIFNVIESVFDVFE